LATELIILDGQTLNGADRLGDWKTNSLEGWWDSPEPRGEEAERPQADGDFDLEVFYKARYVTITGRLRAETHEALHQGMNRFSALVQKRARLQVSGHGPAQWADVRRASGLSIAPVTDTFAHWQVRLKAVDPRKFGDLNTFTATPGAPTTVYHRGNYPALPKITVMGDTPNGYTLTVNGWSYTVSVPLVAGSPHVIDYNDGRLRIGGAVVQNSLGTTNTEYVWPGQSEQFSISRTTPAGSPVATMEVLNTYI
jgi:hypothetical protein